MLTSTTQKKSQGFSLIELVMVTAMIMILAVIAVPRVMNTINDVNLRYAATNFGGLLQSARMQAVRRNTYYTVQSTTLSTIGLAYYVDIPKTGTYAAGDPLLPIGNQITIHLGTGSGAPNEATFTGTTGLLGFAVNPGADPPSFNARGLPCIEASNACPQVPGQGFVAFLSNSSATGNIAWASVAINGSGRVQIWTCDSSGNWVLRN